MFSKDDYQKVKIVATVGPSSDSVETLVEMAHAGADVLRLNLSHKKREEILLNVKNIRAAEKKIGRPLAIMGDLAGPKIRIGEIDGEYTLEPGMKVSIVREKCTGTIDKFSLSHPEILDSLEVGAEVYLGDGIIKLEVEKVSKDIVKTVVGVGGLFKSRMGFSAQGIAVRGFALSLKDKGDVRTLLEAKADAIAISFVQTAKDVQLVKRLLPKEHRPFLVAKIETMAGVENIESILQEADAVMVARGDLGFAVPLASLPHIQKHIIQIAREHAKPVITATQMLESMTHSHLPTRAEISDVANAILDGTDAVMLSGETAAGRNPVHVVATMSKIIKSSTPKLKYDTVFPKDSIADAVSSSVVELANAVNAKLIIAFTESGATAKRISRHRPSQEIIAVTKDIHTFHAMNFVWGTFGVLDPSSTKFDDMIKKAHAIARSVKNTQMKKGDTFVISAGLPFNHTGTTNMALVQTFEEK